MYVCLNFSSFHIRKQSLLKIISVAKDLLINIRKYPLFRISISYDKPFYKLKNMYLLLICSRPMFLSEGILKHYYSFKRSANMGAQKCGQGRAIAFSWISKFYYFFPSLMNLKMTYSSDTT